MCAGVQNCAVWLNPILQDMLRHIFQSCILESNQEILDLIQKVRKHTPREETTLMYTHPVLYFYRCNTVIHTQHVSNAPACFYSMLGLAL